MYYTWVNVNLNLAEWNWFMFPEKLHFLLKISQYIPLFLFHFSFN